MIPGSWVWVSMGWGGGGVVGIPAQQGVCFSLCPSPCSCACQCSLSLKRKKKIKMTLLPLKKIVFCLPMYSREECGLWSILQEFPVKKGVPEAKLRIGCWRYKDGWHKPQVLLRIPYPSRGTHRVSVLYNCAKCYGVPWKGSIHWVRANRQVIPILLSSQLRGYRDARWGVYL